ncbi:hypothetical protein K2173_023544 [Erythroxylum novogranatense]|uniref:Isovaleryl-CoA dehydrogenase n=1 Tax=Erythroxylum novogranatense TaxID=1862640 RepID=A0AAV8TNX0_9ROSI|nr:hypothetical protein K2173_023544 [Erythroxylum novogranatense]
MNAFNNQKNKYKLNSYLKQVVSSQISKSLTPLHLSQNLRLPYQPSINHHLHKLFQFKESVNQFALENIAPHASKIDHTNYFPKEVNVWKLIGDFNLLRITAPEEYRELGLGYLYHCIAMEEISRVFASVGLSYSARSNLCINQLCKANRVEGGYILNGNKMWCTNGPVAQTLVACAKTDVKVGSKGITTFIIEKGMPGFSTAQKLDKLGMRGSDTCDLVFENCFVPEENVLGEEGKGVYVMMLGLDLKRFVLSTGPIGIIQACFDQFGQPIRHFQFIQGKLADMHTSLQSSRSYVYSVARDMACSACLGNVITCVFVTFQDCVGVILCAAERATRVALQIGTGTSEIKRIVIGQELFKE